MVDYSKWDRMDFGSDSDNDDENNDDGSGPRVTSLDQPGKVTIGTDGSLEIGKSSCLPPTPPPPPPRASSSQQSSYYPTVSGSVGGDVIDISNSDNEQQNNIKIQQWRNRLTHNGGEHHCIVNGNSTPIIRGGEQQTVVKRKLPVYWSQDRDAITLRVGFPPELFPARDIRVRVKGALKYADRFSAVGSGVIMNDSSDNNDIDGTAFFGSIEIVSLLSNNHNHNESRETVLLAGKLPHPIHLNQDEDEIDFEIEDNILCSDDGTKAKEQGDPKNDEECAKLVTIILPKAVPMAGMVVWWDRPLLTAEGYPKIDVSAIRERRKEGSKGGAGASSGSQRSSEDGKKKSEAFQKAWEEAHELFREKMKTKVKQGVDLH